MLNRLTEPIPAPAFRYTLTEWGTLWIAGFYILTTFVLFFQLVQPSLAGKGNLRIGADSRIYLWYAGVPNVAPPDGTEASDTAPSLISLTGNFIGPLAIAWMLKSNFLILLFNYSLLFLSFLLLVQAADVRWWLLLCLLLFNPITLMSILTLNKEILCLFSVSLLFFYRTRQSRPKSLLILLLVVSLLTRWEQCLLVLVFLAAASERKLFRRHRALIAAALTAAISLIYPVIASHGGASLTTAADLQGRTIIFLDNLQAHYLYFLAVLPKAALSLYSAIISPWNWPNYDWRDLPNSSFLIWDSVMNLVLTATVIVSLRRRKALSMANDYIYFALLCVILLSVAPFTNMRYMYPVYIMLALETSRPAQKAQVEGSAA